MIVVRNIRAYCLDADGVVLEWEYEDTSEDLATYTIEVLRSEGEAGAYTAVSSALDASAMSSYEDTTVNLLSKWRDYQWRLRVTNTDNAKARTYGSVPYEQVLAQGLDPGSIVLDAPLDLVAVEASRRFDLVLQEFIGRRLLVFPSKTTGTRCTNCWDALKRRVKFSNCQTCYGTGVVGGFYAAQQAYAARVPPHETTQLTALFEMEPNDVLLWMGTRPRVKKRDILVDTEGRRWRVLQKQRSEKLWALTRQIVQVRQVTRDQVEYAIPLTEGWGTGVTSTSPPRNFLNATDIDSYHEGVRELGLLATELE